MTAKQKRVIDYLTKSKGIGATAALMDRAIKEKRSIIEIMEEENKKTMNQ